jgi:hypothetical protein
MSSFNRYINRLHDETTDRPLRLSPYSGPGHNARPTAPTWFPGKGDKGKNPAHPGNFYTTKLRAKLAWWRHPKQLPKAAPTIPTTWSESQLHRQVHFQTASSPTKIYRPARYSFRNTSSSRWSQDRSLHGFGCRRPTIPIKKPSINSATWQTFGTRPLPTKQRHGQAAYTLRDPEEPSKYPATKQLYGLSWMSRALFSMCPSRNHIANTSAATSRFKRSCKASLFRYNPRILDIGVAPTQDCLPHHQPRQGHTIATTTIKL